VEGGILQMQKLKDFDDLFKTGVRSKHPEFLVVFSRELVDPQNSESAVIASKKAVHKRAVHRNRTKRRLRALMQNFSLSHTLLPAKWCILGNRHTSQCLWSALEFSIEKFGLSNNLPKVEAINNHGLIAPQVVESP
jgi:ribonuclease P protein component